MIARFVSASVVAHVVVAIGLHSIRVPPLPVKKPIIVEIRTVSDVLTPEPPAPKPPAPAVIPAAEVPVAEKAAPAVTVTKNEAATEEVAKEAVTEIFKPVDKPEEKVAEKPEAKTDTKTEEVATKEVTPTPAAPLTPKPLVEAITPAPPTTLTGNAAEGSGGNGGSGAGNNPQGTGYGGGPGAGGMTGAGGTMGVEAGGGGVGGGNGLAPGSPGSGALLGALAAAFGVGGTGTGAGIGGSGGGGGGGGGSAASRAAAIAAAAAKPPALPSCGHCADPTACVDLNSDVTNCGACGHACKSKEKCTAGVCNGNGPEYIVQALDFDHITDYDPIAGMQPGGFYYFMQHLDGSQSDIAGLLNAMIAEGTLNIFLNFPAADSVGGPVSILTGSTPSTVDPSVPPTNLDGSGYVPGQPTYKEQTLHGGGAPILTFEYWISSQVHFTVPIAIDSFKFDFSTNYGTLTGSFDINALYGNVTFLNQLATLLNWEASPASGIPSQDQQAITLLLTSGFGGVSTCPPGIATTGSNGTISACDVYKAAKQGLFKGYPVNLAPDLAVYSTNNSGYYPGELPPSTPKDSLTIGLGFQVQPMPMHF